ncbi:hypothetical protein G647_03241 [Cladophialophora carrionii CBS 160.54]|uniref:A-kinase anchor protein 7-like phosphoesterase domain-containing protein n=1 Tax=Cladophialophora carrionii CBS 160.54 TaxID=1279043 RepID=V9DHU3_9EURO|nr:uncharacterized protein G647_03241 [Cladophialophora carrionii CBS 160.54]ETI26464.1 hypothetical protein G647_03241 [Cladophialophora carrionii CBS 160.54]
MTSAQGELTNSKKARAKPKPQPRHAPPTHFLCFPLVTDESVRQLTESLAYFRSVTTPLPEQDPDATPEREDQDQQESTTKDGERQKLRLLPESAHRPPGTYHLTLGTMNLSKQEDMDKAVALLQQIDYLALLKDAGSVDGIVRQARGRARANNAETQVETKSMLEERHDGGEGDGPPRRQSGEATILSNPGSSESANTLSHPESSEESQDNLLASTEPTKGGPPSSSSSSSQLHALKSLTRPISPPPLTTSSTSITTSPSPAVPPLSISLHSLGVFPKPTGARVFFAHPHDPSHRLQTFGQSIRRRFRDAGLITETRPLVLHATVANLIYARGKDRRGGRGGGKGKSSANARPRARDGTVDATEVLRFFNGDDNRGRSARQGEYMGALSESMALDMSAQKTIQKPQRPEADSHATLHVQSDHERDHHHNHSSPYVWARDIPITCVRICKMGAESSVLPGWGLEYRAVAERVFMPDAVREREPRVGN